MIYLLLFQVLTKRGLKFINIPTTLLAQVDASIGGKTGINSNQGKNLIGTFYQPDFILSDTLILKKFTKKRNGLWLWRNFKTFINFR